MAKRTKSEQPGEFNPRNHRRPGLSDEKIEELKESFDLFDLDGSGEINPKQLKTVMQSLGFDPKNPTIYQMISAIDSDGSGAISFDEFVDVMTSRAADKDTRANINKVFRLFDDDKTGLISIKNLRRVARELSETISDEELMEMIERADSDGDAQITPDDFYSIMTRTKFP